MDLDVTFFLQAFIVAVVLLTLGPTLFSPILDVLDLRERNIAGAKADSARLLGETKQKEHELQSQLEGARRQALGERQKMIDEARESERQLLDKARQEAMKKIEGARAALQASEKNARVQLQQNGKDLAKTIATKILARDVA